jgi:hypothetical protein
MRTKYELKSCYEDVKVVFHKGKLPCDLHHIKAVEYKGRRLPEGNSSKDIRTGHKIASVPEPVVSTMSLIATPNGESMWVNKFSTDEVVACSLDVHPSAYYQIEMSFITTSFADDTIRIHYKAVPCDDNGLPLIPDNEDYKQAIYYYVRSMMIGAGYKDTVYNIPMLNQLWETHAARAIGQITYPSIDSMESKVNGMVRFIPQANYFDNFFRTTPEPNY